MSGTVKRYVYYFSKIPTRQWHASVERSSGTYGHETLEGAGVRRVGPSMHSYASAPAYAREEEVRTEDI